MLSNHYARDFYLNNYDSGQEVGTEYMMGCVNKFLKKLYNFGMGYKDRAIKMKEVRLKKRLTQAEVAKKAGLNTNYYAVIERGEVDPYSDTLEKIAQALGIKFI